jgi:hypothetical protein
MPPGQFLLMIGTLMTLRYGSLQCFSRDPALFLKPGFYLEKKHGLLKTSASEKNYKVQTVQGLQTLEIHSNTALGTEPLLLSANSAGFEILLPMKDQIFQHLKISRK